MKKCSQAKIVEKVVRLCCLSGEATPVKSREVGAAQGSKALPTSRMFFRTSKQAVLTEMQH
jgi:hypothetical protein